MIVRLISFPKPFFTAVTNLAAQLRHQSLCMVVSFRSVCVAFVWEGSSSLGAAIRTSYGCLCRKPAVANVFRCFFINSRNRIMLNNSFSSYPWQQVGGGSEHSLLQLSKKCHVSSWRGLFHIKIQASLLWIIDWLYKDAAVYTKW